MEEWINGILSHGLYAGLTLTLIVCGLGLPLPEEAVFLAAGYVGREQGANVWVLCACGVLGIILGDSIPYWVGRKYGVAMIKRRPFSWFLSEKSLAKTRTFFEKHGSKTVFCGRFVAGLRMPTFFMSGSMGVSYPKFVMWDLAGALLSCPISIWLAYRYGKEAKEMLSKSTPILLGVIALIVLYMVYHVWSHREKPDDNLTEEAKPMQAVQPPPLDAEV